MRKREIVAVTLLFAVLSMSIIIGSQAFANDIEPVLDATTEVKWEVIHASAEPFSMYFTGGGICAIENESAISFTVSEVEEDVGGLLAIGNVTVIANDTDVALDLVLGIGVFSAFEPGLFVKVGSGDITQLNESAYSTAERVSGNSMNGTISSLYDNVTIGDNEYEAIIFDYVQDTPAGGDPQRTHLVYDVNTGVLLYANTSYWLGEGFNPYWLEFQFVEIAHEGVISPPIFLYTIIIVTVIVVLLVIMIITKRR